MEIPKTLKPTWDKVANDGVITKDDYAKLLVAAAPHNKDTEVDDSESKFLGNLKSELEKNGGSKGSVPVEGLSFINNTPPQVVKEKDLGEVPPTMKQAWNAAMSDGKISQDEYKTLLHAASPNWNDSELDDKEKNFLGNLQALLKNSKEPVAIEKSATPAPEQKVSAPVKTAPTAKTQPTQKVTAPAKATTPDKASTQAPVPTQQTQPAQTDDTATDDSTTVETPPEVKGESDQDIEHLNKVKTILASINDPDFTPLQGIVEQRITNNGSLKQFSSDVNKIMGSIKAGDKASMNQAKAQVQASYDKLSAGTKSNPDVNNLFKYAMGSIDSQLSGKVRPRPAATQPQPTNNTSTSAKPNTPAKSDVIPFVDSAPDTTTAATDDKTTTETTATQPDVLSDLGDVPDTLKSTWDPIVAKGQVTADDYASLLKAAAPTGKDEELDQNEQAFLGKLKTKLEAGNGTFDLKPAAPTETTGTPDTKTDNSTAPTDQLTAPAKPVLLNWPGYNAETKGALKSAYGKDVTGVKMPLLSPKATKAVVQAFGVSNVTELQQKVHAKVDGKFGPETFFQAKVYVASLMNTPGSNPEEIKRMLSALGNDKEVQQMIAGKTNSFTSQPAGKADETTAPATEGVQGPGNDEVPPTLKGAWDKIVTKGKIDSTDYQSLLDAAAPTKNDKEFDQGELTFIKKVKTLLEQNGGEVTLQKPAETTAPTDKTAPADDSVPTSLKPTWDKILTKGTINADDYNALIKAAAPTGDDKELSADELTFIKKVKTALEQNGGEVTIQKPAATDKPTSTQASSPATDDGVPATLKSTWKKVTADGKLTKEGYQQLVTAAAPHKKNSEFDNEELQFLGTIRDLFDKNKADVLELNASQTDDTKVADKPAAKPVSQPAATDNSNPSVPPTLKAAWSKIIAKGKVTTDDYQTLLAAAAPNKKDTEFDSAEVKFLKALKQKLTDANGTLVLRK